MISFFSMMILALLLAGQAGHAEQAAKALESTKVESSSTANKAAGVERPGTVNESAEAVKPDQFKKTKEIEEAQEKSVKVEVSKKAIKSGQIQESPENPEEESAAEKPSEKSGEKSTTEEPAQVQVETNEAAKPEEPVSPEVVQANSLLVAQKFQEAEKLYRQELAQDKSGDTHVGMIYSLIEQHKIREARGVLRIAKDKFGSKPNLLAAAGYIALLNGRRLNTGSSERKRFFSAAEKLCSGAIEKECMAQPALVLAQVQAESGNLDLADEYLNMAFRIAIVESQPWDKIQPVSQKMKPHYKYASYVLRRTNYNLTESEFRLVLDKLNAPEIFYPHLDPGVELGKGAVTWKDLIRLLKLKQRSKELILCE